MSAGADPIEEYLRELAAELRVRGAMRRRILSEVREHLLEGSACDGQDARSGAVRAIARFGPATETASRFNELRRPRQLALARAIAPWAIAFGATSIATASVWAFQPARTPAAPGAVRASGQSSCLRAPTTRLVRSRDAECPARYGSGR